MDKVARRPKPVVRFYREGVELDAEQFWQAVRDLGGQAVVVAHDPKPLEGGYTLTPKGEAALRTERPLEPEDFFLEDGPFATEAGLRAALRREEGAMPDRR